MFFTIKKHDLKVYSESLSVINKSSKGRKMCFVKEKTCRMIMFVSDTHIYIYIDLVYWNIYYMLQFGSPTP